MVFGRIDVNLLYMQSLWIDYARHMAHMIVMVVPTQFIEENLVSYMLKKKPIKWFEFKHFPKDRILEKGSDFG